MFKTTFADEPKLSPPHIKALIGTYREQRQTGLIRLAYQDKPLYLFFKRGELINAYFLHNDSLESVDADQSIGWIQNAGEVFTRQAPLSPFALLMCKLLLQNRAGRTENISGPVELVNSLQARAALPETCLAFVEWDSVSRAILFPGRPDQLYSIFISPENLSEDAGISSAFQVWKEPRCSVTIFGPDTSVDAWQEYYLRRAFGTICELTLPHFEALTGRALLDSLLRLLAVLAARENLEINILARRVIDREVFSSPQQAAHHYRLLLTELFEHISAVIGPRLLASLLREILVSLPPMERESVHLHALIPPGNIYDENQSNS